ncbi:alpha/beta fold hydrolase [Amycolatopsis sp. FDAARGOS 1241]|uniref:alpha/beta fold hydrolase n=1 Tax=Amycolatopsis sp. FDAARGOS 1241 TaxID=2778070 RepID=UPI0019521113|nr:alpha/beta fold hydrolase [Amycolatopsis sp. FDAARGOS 1241]QRP48167.1 alpha/beta fold hydrolase [Amycolatopsis sp. FDAARGOS 1241]
MPTLHLNDTVLGYDDRGTGDRALLLVHGHPFDRSMWRPQTEHFADRGFRVVVPDLRGYGQSTGEPVAALVDYTADLIALADHLDLGTFVLGGLSMGGQIAMQTVAEHPGRVEALLLADTFPAAETPEGRRGRRAAATRIETEGMAAYAEELLPKMVSARTRTRNPQVTAHVRTMMRTAPPHGAAAALRARALRPDYRRALEDVRVPTLVLTGSEDEFTTVADAELMHRLVPRSELAVVEGAGHLPNLECVAEFNDVFGRFLLSLRPRPDHLVEER